MPVAGDGDLIQLAADVLDGPPKGMSASEEAGEAGEAAGSQVQSGESGSLPNVRKLLCCCCNGCAMP